MYPQPVVRCFSAFALVVSFALLTACGGGGGFKPAPVKSLTHILVDPGNATIGKGKTLQLKATAVYSDGTVLDVTASAAWTTSQATVAPVSSSGIVTGMSAGNAQISATYQGMAGSDPITVQPAAVVSISISPSNPAIGKSKTLQLTATASMSDGSVQDITPVATWATGQAAVAAVGATGMVTGMTAGNAQISAAYQGETGNDGVTIQPATVVSIAVSPASPAIRKSTTLQLSALGTFSDGTQMDLTALASWGTTQPTIAGVSSTGVMTGMAAGNAIVSAAYQGTTGTDAVTIQPAALQSITITPGNIGIDKGKNFQLTATGSFADGTQQDITAQATWTTNQPNIAWVAGGGMVTGVAPGSATVSAVYQGVTGNDPVTVQQPSLVSINVTPKKSLILVGEREQLAAIAAWSDGTTQDVSKSATWSSLATAYVNVSALGAVVGNSAGSAMIKAEYGSMSGAAKVAVTSANAVGLVIVPDKFTLALGTGKQFKAIATLSDGSHLDITEWANWTSAHSEIVDVSAGGSAMAARVGSAEITASASSVSASAPVTVLPASAVGYFDLTAAGIAGGASTVRLSNAGITGDDLCSMIYVFDQNQELTECCGCRVTDSGLREFSIPNDLNGNPLTATPTQQGSIEIVPSDPAANPTCDPRSLSPAGLIVGWGTNGQMVSSNSAQVTETPFSRVPLTRKAVAELAGLCTALQQLGSGRGICTCGTGD